MLNRCVLTLDDQVMETEMESNAKKWAKKEASLLKDIDNLNIKLEENMVQSQMAPPQEKKHDSEHVSHVAESHATGSHAASQRSPDMPVHAMTVADSEALEKRRESEKGVVNIIEMLAKTLIELSRKEVDGVCGEMRATTKRFEKMPTVRMLLKQGESGDDIDRVSRTKIEELITRWISAHMKQALKDGKLPEGTTVVVNNVTTDLDDGIVLLEFFNLVLPEKFKWPDNKVQSARMASVVKRGELFANTMLDLTGDSEWEEFDFFVEEGSVEKRLRFLSLFYLLSSGFTGSAWGAGQQLASNMNAVQDTAEHIQQGADKLLVTPHFATSHFIYVCMYICMCMHVCVCMYVCMHA